MVPSSQDQGGEATDMMCGHLFDSYHVSNENKIVVVEVQDGKERARK